METKVYHAVVTDESDRFWLIYIPELDRSTQALKSEDEIREMAVDLIATIEDIPEEDIGLQIDFR